MTQPIDQQDAVKVDPRHYKFESENEQVRVLRISYGPNEKSNMHSHPAAIVVFLTGAHIRFNYPDGKTEDIRSKAGEAVFTPAQTHLPENLSNEPLEAVLVELKR